MLSTANITMQFGPKPLFENISVKFGEGNRYGLIGANGCGKSTFMKILGSDLEPSSGNVMLEPNIRLGKLRQDQFAYEDMRVLDVVMMGHTEMWAAMTERDAIYANPDATDDDYMHAADLEAKFAEYDGYTAEARAGELLLGIGIAIDDHNGPMSNVAPGWKLRVLLAQALFSKPDVLLLDEPTNNLDINSIRWLEDVLNQYNSTMIIISHDRHFLNQVCTHMARHGLRHAEGLSGQLRRLHAREHAGDASASRPRTRRRRTASPICRTSCAASRRTSRRRARPRAARSRSRRSRSRNSSRRRARIRLSASTSRRSCTTDDLEGYTRLKGETGITLAAGEHWYTRWNVKPFLDRGLVSFVQSDPEWCGGISEWLRICELARGYPGVQVIPHGHHVLAASNCVASQPEALCPMMEYLFQSRVRFQHCQTRPLVASAGTFVMAEEPGLGPSLDEARLVRVDSPAV